MKWLFSLWVAVLLLLLLLLPLLASGCVVVPRYQREVFANPAMDPRARSLETRSTNKLHDSREVAAGGDGRAAGGGCACGN